MDAAHTPPSKPRYPLAGRELTRPEFTALYLKLNSGVYAAADYLCRMGYSLHATRELLLREFKDTV